MKLFKTISVLTLLSLAGFASAQNVFVYTSKCVCGYEPGDVPLLSQNVNQAPIAGYEALKPGNYATVTNFTNVSLNPTNIALLIGAELPSISGGTRYYLTTVIPTRPIQLMTSNRTDCINYAAAFNALTGPDRPVPLTGQSFEGVVFVASEQETLDVQGVFTYANKDQFENHYLYIANQEGVGFWGRKKDDHDWFLPWPQEYQQDFTGTGAGGLGLGASIEIEHSAPRILVMGTEGVDGESVMDTFIDTALSEAAKR